MDDYAIRKTALRLAVEYHVEETEVVKLAKEFEKYLRGPKPKPEQPVGDKPQQTWRERRGLT